MSDSETSAVRVVENDSTNSGPTKDKNPSEANSDVNDTSGTTRTSKQEPIVKITGDSTTRRPRQHQETIPNAFSRRETTDSRPVASSVYSTDAEEVPAWLKSAKPTDKYDKYGSRSGTISARQTTPSDDKYSKYGANSNGMSRIKRKRELEDEGDEDRDDKSALPEEPVTQPYSVAANPAAYKGTNGDDYQRQYLTFHSSIANKASKDINSIVRTHYNQRTYQSKLQGPRTASPIYKLRNFNNAIKYILLGNYVKKSSEYADTPSSILDLCCGKGGDLNKCEFVNIEQYIGIDISDASVKEAFSRYSQNKARFIPRGALAHKRKDSKRYQFEACFATGDCFTYSVPDILEPNFPGIIDKVFPVDCVSIQFALHYAFETEDKVHMILLNVSKSLRQGGTFVGTIPSSDFIRDKIVKKDYLPDKDGKKRFGNDLYSVTFEKEPPADGVFRPPFGNKYNYSLKDAIDDVPEYVVPFETLRALCEDYGMTLKYKKNFIDIFNQEIPKYFSRLNKNLIEGMKRSDGKYGAEGMEKEAVAFYIGFVFEKL